MKNIIITIMTLSLLLGGCATAPAGVDWSALGEAVELSGDIQCVGKGKLEVLGFVGIDARGLAQAAGELDAAGERDGAACAGVWVGLGPMSWAWFAHSQSDPECKKRSGTLLKLPANKLE